MVKETEYYDILEVETTANPDQIKRAYRRMAIKTHPDKNPDDPKAQEKFQAISEAYQVLSDANLRQKYDTFGKAEAKPDEGFEDPVAFATSIFGGGAFESFIGEIALVKEMTQLGELEQEAEKEEAAAKSSKEGSAAEVDGNVHSGAASSSGSTNSQAKSELKSHRLHIGHHKTESGSTASPTATGASKLAADKEAKLAAKQKRKQELERLDKENREAREARVETLTKQLIEKISVYTETSKNKEFTSNYILKLEEEAASLKMESFGLQLLHVIGHVYYTRASLFLKSQKLFGFGGMFGKIKEAGSMMRDVYDAISATMEAQNYIQTASELESNVSSEKQVELEQMILGKVLGALWVGSRFEIQGILRLVCDRVLHDKSVPLSKRVERAHALKVMGTVFKSTKRTKEEAEEMQFFETLVAEANAKKAKKLRKDMSAGAAVASSMNETRGESQAPQQHA